MLFGGGKSACNFSGRVACGTAGAFACGISLAINAIRWLELDE
jgi:hypothetical protein